MFIETGILALIIGYILKGRLKNIDIDKIKGISIVLFAFLIKLTLVMGIQRGFLKPGFLTFCAYIVQYSLVLVFVFLNRSDPFLLIMGMGVLLNAIPIFSNGGTMPVSLKAAQEASLKLNVGSEGLYKAVDSTTRFAFLGDVIPETLIRHFVISLGDIVTAIGMVLFIIFGMIKKPLEIKGEV